MRNPTNSVAKISQDVIGIIQDKFGSNPENFYGQAPHEIPQDLTKILQDRTGIHLVKSRPNPMDRHPTRSQKILQRSRKTELGFTL